MSKATTWDRNAVAAMLKEHGVHDLVELVREEVAAVADPTKAPGSPERWCYFALTGLDSLLEELEKV